MNELVELALVHRSPAVEIEHVEEDVEVVGDVHLEGGTAMRIVKSQNAAIVGAN